MLIDNKSDMMTVETVRDRWNKVTDMTNGEFPTAQTATMDVVQKLSKLNVDKQLDQNNNGNHDKVKIINAKRHLKHLQSQGEN